MYIINDICYAGEATEEMKIVRVKPLVGRMLLVTFSTGETRLYDTTRLTGPAFQPLDDERIFNDVVLFHGIPTWMDGEIDIAPETVYADSYPYEVDGVDCITA